MGESKGGYPTGNRLMAALCVAGVVIGLGSGMVITRLTAPAPKKAADAADATVLRVRLTPEGGAAITLDGEALGQATAEPIDGDGLAQAARSVRDSKLAAVRVRIDRGAPDAITARITSELEAAGARVELSAVDPEAN